MRVILASGSPRRIDLLGRIFDNFDVMPQNADETLHYKQPHLALVNLAKRKSEPITLREPKDTLVISADTVVWYGGKYYNKPADAADAKRMLRELSGRTHYVYTGVCLYYNGRYLTFYDKSEVTFRELDEKFIEEYVASGKPMDKAGAYGIQDGEIVERYRGSYTNIVGLPMEKLEEYIAAITEEENEN